MSLMANYNVPSDLLQIPDVSGIRRQIKYAEDVQSDAKTIKRTDFHNAIDVKYNNSLKNLVSKILSFDASFCGI